MTSRDRIASRLAELARLLRESKTRDDVVRVANDLDRIAALGGQ